MLVPKFPFSMLVKEMFENFKPLLVMLYFGTLPCQLLLDFWLCMGNILLFPIYPSVVAILAIYILNNRRKREQMQTGYKQMPIEQAVEEYPKAAKPKEESSLQVGHKQTLAEYEELLKKKGEGKRE